jgi:copper ion binding protein
MNAGTTQQLTYSVPGISCEHCRTAITTEVNKLAGVRAVDVDLEAKRVSVTGSGLDDAAVRDAIDEAGYDIA